jgi:hypothetical protein
VGTLRSHPQANLFKGLSYLFNNYETQMIKRLIRKYKQLKIEETNNVIGSIFAKAVFLLHEDVLKEEAKNQPDNNETLKQLLLAETRKVESWLKKKKVEKGEKEIKSAIETSKKHFAEIRPTLGRKAHRETESTAVIEISDLESKKVEKMKNTEIIQRTFKF